ncbi:MAG TPA: DUF4864 domain-containing protein [Leptolyngbyaceae cyanobacterium]
MELSEADQLAIRTVVEQQLKALRADDGERAFSFAAPRIQQQFDTAERFMRMVKTAYQPVYRPRSVMFEGLTWMQSLPAQQVMLMAEGGELVRAYYLMERQPDRQWRIAGCYLVFLKDEKR